MTKEEAMKWFKDIGNGSGVDRTKFPNHLKGSIAKRIWHDCDFTYGVEYGVLIALMEIFDITPEDLGWTPEDIERRTCEVNQE